MSSGTGHKKTIQFPDKLFITGTDTGIGKTFISGVLCEGLNAHSNTYYWKPIQSGKTHPTDSNWIKSFTSLPESHILKETYLTNEPLSPHLSSKMDGIHISLEKLPLPSIEKTSDKQHLIIEGCGGLMVPINENELLIDLLEKWNIPSLIVARSALGTINHTLLTIEKLKEKKLPICGVVLDGPINTANKEAIEHYGKVPVIAQIPTQAEVSAKILKNLFDKHFG